MILAHDHIVLPGYFRQASIRRVSLITKLINYNKVSLITCRSLYSFAFLSSTDPSFVFLPLSPALLHLSCLLHVQLRPSFYLQLIEQPVGARVHRLTHGGQTASRDHQIFKMVGGARWCDSGTEEALAGLLSGSSRKQTRAPTIKK